MATITIKTVQGQSVYDIALQYYGSIEKINKVLEASNITDFLATIAPGTEITLEDVEDNLVNQFLATRRPVATDNFDPLPLQGDEGLNLTGDEGQLLFGD